MRKELEKKLIELGVENAKEITEPEMADLLNGMEEIGFCEGALIKSGTHTMIATKKERLNDLMVRGDSSGIIHYVKEADRSDLLASMLAHLLERKLKKNVEL